MRDDVARALAARALEVAQKTKSQQGPKGEKGDAGQIIVQPNKGDKGDTGPMGLQGIPGKSITGPKGDKGDKGDPGQKGDKGDKGESGAKGDTGERGERGFQGLKGLDGSKGDIGPMPKHEKKGLMIRFEKEPGTWGEWIIMPTSGGGGGGRDDKLTDRQAELVALAEFYKTRGSNANKYIKTDGTTLTWDTLDGSDINLSSPPAIGGTAPNTGSFATLNSTSGALNGTIGATTPSSVNATTITGQTGVLRGTGTNLVLQSSSLTTTWTAVGTTLTGSQADPFGGTTASLLNNGTSTGNHVILQSVTVSALPYTFSVYAKVGTANFVGLYDGLASRGAFFNVSNGTFSSNIVAAPTSYSITNAGNGWYRVSITITPTAGSNTIYLWMSEDGTSFSYTGTSKTIILAAPQYEIGSVLNTYIPTTTTAVYGTPTLSFSGVSTIGLESNGALYVSPAGTGALQAQATTSTTAGGNARGANAVDWQTARDTAARVASGSLTSIGGGYGNTANGVQAAISGGTFNTVSGTYNFVGAGYGNTATLTASSVVGGFSNTAGGFYNFVGGGYTNSGTAAATVTTQSATMNGTTTVTLSGSNASIKVGQLIGGTYINANLTYVAAISGTTLTLSTAATGSGTATLSFYTPHGVVVGGGNNQATGSYSFIGGGGDAGTAANRNVASGDWSTVGGGIKNTATGLYSIIGGGNTNITSGAYSIAAGGQNNNASNLYSTISGGVDNVSNSAVSTVAGGFKGTTRGITGYTVFPSCYIPISNTLGVSQAALLILGKQTTDATATVLTSDTGGAGGTNQVILPNNSAYFFKGEVISGVTGGGDTKGWTIEGVIKRGANAASTALVGTPTVTSTYADAGASTWVIAVTADTTNGGLRVTFTGQASTTIRTVCQIRTTEMTY